jgi:hypothetical protein
MANGGFNPAYNLQLATDADSRMIVGVQVTNSGSDSRQLAPMLNEIERRCGRLPHQHLADGGYLHFQSCEQAATQGVELFVPLLAHRGYVDPFKLQSRESRAISELRRRMCSARGQQIYRARAATAETVNAELRSRHALNRPLLRGTAKVLCAALWSAPTYNLMRAIRMNWL